LGDEHTTASEVEVDALRPLRPERAPIPCDDPGPILRRRRPEHEPWRDAGWPDRHRRSQLEIEERGDHAEPRAEVETEGDRVVALLHQPDLRDASPGDFHQSLDEPPPDAAPRGARIDRDRADRRDGAARMEPRDADDVAVLLGDEPPERIEIEQVSDVAAALDRGRHHRRDPVLDRGAIEGDEVQLARGIDIT